MSEKTLELHEKLTVRANEVRDQMKSVVKRAESEDRDLSDDETKVIEGHQAKIRSLDSQAEIAEQALHREAKHAERVAQVVHSIPQAEHELTALAARRTCTPRRPRGCGWTRVARAS